MAIGLAAFFKAATEYHGLMDKPLRPPQYQSDDLKHEVKRRCQWLVNDCMTVMRARWEHQDWFIANQPPDGDSVGLGGGNYMMATALFSALNLLSKVHYHLVKPERFCTKADYENDAEIRGVVLSAISDPRIRKELKSHWRKRRIGECDEASAFRALIDALRDDGHSIGIPKGKESEIWNLFRNELAHGAESAAYLRIRKRPAAAEGTTLAELEEFVRSEVAIPTKPNSNPKASRTGFRREAEQRSERSDAGVLIVG